MRSICISMLEFLQTIRFVQNFFVFLYKLTIQLRRRKETANAVDHLSAYEAGKWFIYMKTSDFYCAEC